MIRITTAVCHQSTPIYLRTFVSLMPLTKPPFRGWGHKNKKSQLLGTFKI
jgi:hypothetical protein